MPSTEPSDSSMQVPVKYKESDIEELDIGNEGQYNYVLLSDNFEYENQYNYVLLSDTEDPDPTVDIESSQWPEDDTEHYNMYETEGIGETEKTNTSNMFEIIKVNGGNNLSMSSETNKLEQEITAEFIGMKPESVRVKDIQNVDHKMLYQNERNYLQYCGDDCEIFGTAENGENSQNESLVCNSSSSFSTDAYVHQYTEAMDSQGEYTEMRYETLWMQAFQNFIHERQVIDENTAPVVIRKKKATQLQQLLMDASKVLSKDRHIASRSVETKSKDQEGWCETGQSCRQLTSNKRLDYQRPYSFNDSLKMVQETTGSSRDNVTSSSGGREIPRVQSRLNQNKDLDTSSVTVMNTNRVNKYDEQQSEYDEQQREPPKNSNARTATGNNCRSIMPIPTSLKKEPKMKSTTNVSATDAENTRPSNSSSAVRRRHAGITFSSYAGNSNNAGSSTHDHQKTNQKYSQVESTCQSGSFTSTKVKTKLRDKVMASRSPSRQDQVDRFNELWSTDSYNTDSIKRKSRERVVTFEDEVKIKKLPCKYCGRLYRKSYLDTHQKIHTKTGDTKAQRRRKMEEHAARSRKPADSGVQRRLQTVSALQDRSYRCNQCSHSTNTGAHYHRHQALHQYGGVWCFTCNVIFKNAKAMLIWHGRNRVNHASKSKGVKHESQPDKVKHASKSNKVKGASKSDKVKSSSKPAKVKPASKSYRVSAVSGGHLKRTGYVTAASVQKPYKCAQCNYTTNFKQCLSDHSRVHSASQVVWCRLCGVAFMSDHALKVWHAKHDVKHVKQLKTNNKQTLEEPADCDERRFRCSSCNYAVARKALLLRHEVIHESSLALWCSPCGVAFKSTMASAAWHAKHHVKHSY